MLNQTRHYPGGNGGLFEVMDKPPGNLLATQGVASFYKPPPLIVSTDRWLQMMTTAAGVQAIIYFMEHDMTEQKKEYKIDGRPATIYRVVKNKENPYVMVDRRPIDNPKLSYKAKGMLTYLLSRPDGWEINMTDLLKHGTDGEAKIRSGLKELKKAGHMRYTVSRNQGRITGWLIEVFEFPNPPDSDFQQVENLQVENRTQVLSKLNSKQKPNSIKKTSTGKPDFKALAPDKYRTIPELRIFMDATGWIPGSFVLETVYDFVHAGLTKDKIKGAFDEWTARGYKPANVKGYLSWARDGIPPVFRQKFAEKVVNKARSAVDEFLADFIEPEVIDGVAN